MAAIDSAYELQAPDKIHNVEHLDPEAGLSNDRDQRDMDRLGKKQVTKRNFGFVSMLGFSSTLLVTWEGLLIVFITGFENGGPAGLVYGFLFDWIGTLAVFTSISEVASMAPTSGGQYHWVSMLAPRSYRKFLSYITGWLTVIGWQAVVASGGYLSGTLIQGLIVLTHPDYVIERWHGTLLFWAVILLAIFINTVVGSTLPKMESLILILHVLGFFAILIPLVYMAPHGSVSSVFTRFLNEGGWSTQGLSFFIGLTGNVFNLLGSDGAAHMSEEVRDASLVVPRAIILSLILNGLLGFGMLIGFLFCLGDIDAAFGTPTGYPFMEVFLQATKSISGTVTMVAIITALQIFATIGYATSSSRMAWAFARDRAFPQWLHLSKIDSRTSVPIIAVFFTTTIACLVGLINIGSSTAFNDVLSLTVAGFYASYLMTCSLLLWRRWTGAILKFDHRSQSDTSNGDGLIWGPWKVPEPFGTAINAIACAYMVTILFFSFWPSTTPITVATMNFSSIVTGVVVIYCVIFYFWRANKVYKGPVVETGIRG